MELLRNNDINGCADAPIGIVVYLISIIAHDWPFQALLHGKSTSVTGTVKVDSG
jgi:hypothetical protein